MPREKLSTSEYTILGIVWREGPCTTYAVMRELASSASTFYRNRAASTYRVVQRLIDVGLLEPIGDGVGNRGDRLIAATAKGAAALEKWLSPPIPKVEVDHTIDLIRLRVYFLQALDEAGQQRFVEEAIRSVKKRLAELEVGIGDDDLYGTLGSMGTLYETRARLEWLEYLKKNLPAAAADGPLDK